MIHQLRVSVIRRGICMIGITANYEALLMIFIFGVLIVLAVREADLMLAASRRVLIAMVIIFIVAFEPQFTEFAFLPLIPGFQARASGAAHVCSIAIVVIVIVIRFRKAIVTQDCWKAQSADVEYIEGPWQATRATGISIVIITAAVCSPSLHSTEPTVRITQCRPCAAPLTVSGFEGSHQVVVCPTLPTILAPHFHGL